MSPPTSEPILSGETVWQGWSVLFPSLWCYPGILCSTGILLLPWFSPAYLLRHCHWSKLVFLCCGLFLWGKWTRDNCCHPFLQKVFIEKVVWCCDLYIFCSPFFKTLFITILVFWFFFFSGYEYLLFPLSNHFLFSQTMFPVFLDFRCGNLHKNFSIGYEQKECLNLWYINGCNIVSYIPWYIKLSFFFKFYHLW